jgi:parallel beta-helix repeat protein
MKTFKIIFILVSFVLSVQNVLAEPFPYCGDLSFGVNGGDNHWDSYVDLMLPLASKDSSFVFFAPRLSMSGKSVFDGSSNEINLGLGYRKYFENAGFIAGVNAYYDVRNTDLGNNFQQAGAGAEFLSRYFDARINAYFPFGNGKYYIGKSYDIPNGHYIGATYFYEVSLRGFDAEIGGKIPLPQSFGELRCFAGYYYFDSGKIMPEIKGFKARAEYRPLKILRLNYSLYENKDLNAAVWQAGADICVPFDFKEVLQSKNPFRGLAAYIKTAKKSLKERIGESVVRDMRVRSGAARLKHYEDKLKNDYGQDYYFTVVSPEAVPGGQGDGTFENPAALEEGLDLNKAVAGGNANLLLLSGAYAQNSSLDLSFHQAGSLSVIGVSEILYRGADLGKYNNGTPVITFAQGITGMIFDENAQKDILISGVEFRGTGNTGSGLEIKNYNSQNFFFVGNNSFAGFDTGVIINNSAQSVVLVNNIIEGNNTGVEIYSGAAGLEQNIISGNFVYGVYVNAASGAVINSNLIESNGAGINVFKSSDIAIVNNEIYSNLEDGVRISSSAGLSVYSNYIYLNASNGAFAVFSDSLDFEENNIYENESNGIYIANSLTVTLFKNLISQNLHNGIIMEKTSYSYVQSNYAFENGLYGIYVSTGESVSVSYNGVFQNSAGGIYAGNILSGGFNANEVYAHGANDGIEIEGKELTVTSNIVYENNVGIFLKNSQNAEINGNEAYNNSEGIKAQNSSGVSFVDNAASSNSLSGITVSGGNAVTLNANDALGNLGGGISVEGVSNLTFINNLTSANNLFGAKISSSAGASIGYNIIENSGSAHGLVLNGSSNAILAGNNFNSLYLESGYFALYLQAATSFNAIESGSNIFLNNSGYGGDAAPVLNYEINVKNKDSF